MLEIDVLIAGGGPVGLTASILLARHGVRSLVVERHPGTAILPESRGINARTMEMHRQRGHTAYGVQPTGAVLVRPDGYVAWRSASAARDPQHCLSDIATRLFGRALQPALSGD